MKVKTIVYSRTGNSLTCAKEFAKLVGGEPFSLAQKPTSSIGMSAVAGAFGAIFDKSAELKELPDLSDVQNIALFMPVWASTTPPVINAFIRSGLLKDKKIMVIATQSAPGLFAKLADKLPRMIEGQGGVYLGLQVFGGLGSKKVTDEQAKGKAKKWLENYSDALNGA